MRLLQPFFQAPAGRRAAFVLLLLTSFQAAFLTPDLDLVPGERTNLFTGLVSACSLAGAWLFTEGLHTRLHSRAFFLSAALFIFGALSIMLCPIPGAQGSAFFRGSVALASGLGGFWCGRILLRDKRWQYIYAWWSVLLLLALVAFCIAGYVVKDEIHDLLPGAGKHPLVNTIMLLWFGPLFFLATRKKTLIAIGGLSLTASYVALYLSNLRTGVLMPLVLGAASVLLGLLPWRWTLSLLLCFMLLALSFFALFPHKWQEVTRSDREEVYYRVESLPFSWHVAKQHPLLGIGLRTARIPFLQDYQLNWPHVAPARYSESVEKIVTSENTLLTIMVGFGIPFAFLYALGVLRIYGGLGMQLIRLPTLEGLPLLALFLPLTASVTYFFLYDGLMYPQVSWFFHLLLGMVPLRSRNAATNLA